MAVAIPARIPEATSHQALAACADDDKLPCAPVAVGTLKRETTLIRDDIAAMHKELAGAIIATGNEMRILHEDVAWRITQLGDLLKPRDST